MKSQQFSISDIVKKVLIITAVLAVVEVVVIIFYKTKANKEAVSETEQLEPAKPAESEKVISTKPVANIKPAATNDAAVKPVSLPKKDTIISKTVITQKPAPDTAKSHPATKTAAVKPAPKATVEKLQTKQLSPQQMEQILGEIKDEKARLNSTSNCVQVFKTKNSNVENAFAIGSFLKSNGFIISGRETLQTSAKGIHVDGSSACIKVTIGSL